MPDQASKGVGKRGGSECMVSRGESRSLSEIFVLIDCVAE
jgi:hypothetical protein